MFTPRCRITSRFLIFMPIDKQLLEACIRKERRAQHALYKECFSFLMRVGYRYTQNKEDALILVNTAFLKIITQLEKFNEEQNFEFWAKKIMINTAIDNYRKVKKQTEVFSSIDDFENNENYFIDADRADKKYDLEEILKLIQTLPQATRNVFNLFVIDGYSHKEISEMLSISEGTSKWHLSEARKILVKKIEAGIITLLFIL